MAEGRPGLPMPGGPQILRLRATRFAQDDTVWGIWRLAEEDKPRAKDDAAVLKMTPLVLRMRLLMCDDAGG